MPKAIGNASGVSSYILPSPPDESGCYALSFTSPPDESGGYVQETPLALVHISYLHPQINLGVMRCLSLHPQMNLGVMHRKRLWRLLLKKNIYL